MKFFRIPNFTGIEAHRDDADRGTLRRCEGCLPLGPGGLRSGPVWKTIRSKMDGYADLQFTPSETAVNKIEMKLGGTEHRQFSDNDHSNHSPPLGSDYKGRVAIISVSRRGKVHDLKIWNSSTDKMDVEMGLRTVYVNTNPTPTYPQYNKQLDVLLGNESFYDGKLSLLGDRIVVYADGSDDLVKFLEYDPTNQTFLPGLEYKLNSPTSTEKIRDITPDDAWITSASYADSATSATRPDAYFNMENSDFPNCTMFVVGPNKSIYAAGDADNPLTVYVTEPAGLTSTEGAAIIKKTENAYSGWEGQPGASVYSASFPLSAMFRGSRDALYSTGALGRVNLLLSNATRITALSCLGNQVVVHTDAGAHLLYAPSPDQAESGYRVEQAPSSAASAAVNHSVVGGGGGSQNFYLGFDGQIYKDEATARGSENKPLYSDPSQASWKAKGGWDKEHPRDLTTAFSAYDAGMGQYWLFTENKAHPSNRQDTPVEGVSEKTVFTTPPAATLTEESDGSFTFSGQTRIPRFQGWCFDELTDSVSGPFTSAHATAVASVPNTSQLFAVTEAHPGIATAKHMGVFTDLKDLRETSFDAPPTLWADTTTLPTTLDSDTGATDFVVANADGVFAYKGYEYLSPFAEPSLILTGNPSLTNAMVFRSASLSLMETAWMHLGNEHDEKQVHRVDLSFRKNSAGRLWLYVESDEGKVSGQYKGAIQEHVKVFTNLRGRRFRVRMFIVTHHLYPWNLREMAIGHLMGKSF